MVLRALVVDPNPARGLMYRELLANEGLDAFVVPDGQQACKFLESGERIYLLVTELSLPRIDGFGVLRRLQRTESAGIPVLVATAFHEMRETALRLREELGISAVVSPSISPEALLDVVVRILEGEEEIVADESAWDTLDPDDPVSLAEAYQTEMRRLESIRKAGVTFADQQAVNDGAVRGAGVPLIGSDGEAWGALCVIDDAKR